MAIRSKGETMDVASMLSQPEAGAVLQGPQLDHAIPTPRSEHLLIRTESECLYRRGMRLPGQVQHFPAVTPHACSSAPAAHRPGGSMGVRCHGPGRIKVLGKDRLSQHGPGKRRILHLEILKIGATQHKMRQRKYTRKAPLLSRHAHQIRRHIYLA